MPALPVSARGTGGEFEIVRDSMNSTPPKDMPTEAAVRDALRQVNDPEVGMNIVDLGLVYRVQIAERALRVEMSMTSPACPLGDMMVEQARAALSRLMPSDTELTVQLVWEPPWSPTMMSEAAKQRFGWK